MANHYWADRGGVDSDHDGLSDEFEENVLGTSPKLRDTDGDGLNDFRERDFGSNPLQPDSDLDGVNDYREVIVGTTQGYQPGRPGFFVYPADAASNNERCFVITAATRRVHPL